MEKITPKREQEYSSILERPEPSVFKIGRYAALQLSAAERDLFTDLEEKESGNYIISGLSKKITELDFTAFTFAIGQILYNQSYKSNNEDINSGLKREQAEKLSNETGLNLFSGYISTSLNEICRLGYGVQEPTTELKKKISATLDTIHKTPIEITFPNGDRLQSYICTTKEKYTRAKDGAVFYDLWLNPIFGVEITKQFGELPQDVITQIELSCKNKKQRKQAGHYLLLRWLSTQDKRQPKTRYIGEIVRELRMEEYYKKNKGMAETQIISICNTMVDIGILKEYKPEYKDTTRGKRIEKITFNLNKDYIRTHKEDEPKQTKKKNNK